MTHIYNDPADFKDEAVTGFSSAYSRYVQQVPSASGFVRRGGPSKGKVSLVVGGGAGHYPSYGGIVGSGFADGAVLGEVFTSPSTEQIHRIARAAHGGAGLLMMFGNYAGDRLNFAAAQERLVAEGIDARIVYVTDDIASAPPGERDQRRGIAGTFTAYKMTGAAADRGDPLDDVERIAAAANAATFSFGVAFGGCTFPGRREPLFTVETGRMEFGLGIHGEPGVRSAGWVPARELAAALVEAVLRERPAGSGGRAAVVVNGLGATKYEELFLLFGQIEPLLAAAGVEIVLPEVGELVTSLDMAGASLSLTWLDPELEELWLAPADTVSFRRSGTAPNVAFDRVAGADPGRAAVAVAESTAAGPGSVAAAAVVRAALAAVAGVVAANSDLLGDIDAVAGDGDHGVGMTRGAQAALRAADAMQGGVAGVLREAGAAFGDRGGGTSGMLWGVLLSEVGGSLGDTEAVTAQRLASALRCGSDAVQRVGKARPGDKTMLDALLPFLDSLDGELAAGAPLAQAWRAAAAVAVRAASDTAALTPRIGRARPLASRSVGTPDAGATSMGLILDALTPVLSAARCSR